MVVLAISFFSGVICNSLNLTNPCTCTKYCIKNDTENLGVSKNTPLIISFNGLEFEKKFDYLNKSDLKLSSESIALKIITNNSLEYLLHVEEFRISPQSYTLKSLKKPMQDFITNSFFLKNRLSLKFGSTQFKVSLDSSNFNIDGLEDYLFRNPSINEVEVYRIIFQNHMDDKIGLCIHELLYSSLKFHNDEVTYSLNIDNQPYKVVFLSRDQYLSSDFLIEAEFSKSSQGQCFISFEENSSQINTIMDRLDESNFTLNTVEDDKYDKSLDGDYDYYGDLFLF